jgi:acetyl-CoA acetyltransferase
MAKLIAERHGILREAQDEYALRSLQGSCASYDNL